jgi:CDP-glycerol glycerophosphotransferase (TagB/SpsB family)
LEFPGTRFSKEDNVYQQIALADFIVGSYSTLLIESIYFDKQPLIYRNDLSDWFIPNGIKLRFSNVEELTDLLLSGLPDIEKQRKEHYWQQGFNKNFENFYQQEILGTHR